MQKIQQALPEEQYMVRIILHNGHIILLNLGSRITTTRFSMLKDKEIFKRLTLKDDFIIWKNKDGDSVELSYTDILYLLQTGESSTGSLNQSSF